MSPGSRRAALLHRWPAMALALVAAAACSRGDAPGAQGAPGGRGAPAPPRPFDFQHPLEALRTDADAAAARLGSFAWEGQVGWTVEKPGSAPVKATERHRVRQLASGEFEASADVDPGGGPGSETGRQVVFSGGMTYARGRWAPFRERPTDRGRDARRFRDDSFRVGGDLLDLYGPALVAQPAGETTALGRRARRYRLGLSDTLPRAAPPPSTLPDGGYDADTRRRVAFLEGRVPLTAAGELVLDAETGVPLSLALQGAFAQRDDPQLKATVDLSARVQSLGPGVAAVHAPRNALADDRKPKGVARALEAAGLRKQPAGARRAEEEEPEEE
jgi:hypothetical protein